MKMEERKYPKMEKARIDSRRDRGVGSEVTIMGETDRKGESISKENEKVMTRKQEIEEEKEYIFGKK